MVNPSLNEINQWLVIGMRPSSSGQAVTVGSSNELGADRAVLSSQINYAGPNPTNIDGTNTNVFPTINYVDGPFAGPDDLNRAVAPSGLRGVFIPGRWAEGPPLPQDNQTPQGNTYPGNAAVGPNVDFLPYTLNGQMFQARTVRGVDWSGNVAVTSSTGIFSLSDINIFANVGFASTSPTAGVNISNSYFFADGSLSGLLMDGMQGGPPNPARGWTAPVNFNQLLTDLRAWRTFLRGLPVESTLNMDIVNQNANTTGPFVYVVPDSLDVNNDGIIVIDIVRGNNDFQVNNSDWVIEGTGNKLIVFRIRGISNMLISNSSIMLGQQFTDVLGPRHIGALFVKVHPEEEGVNSSDTVFNLSNVVMHGIGLWDLNTIGDANTDIDPNIPVDRSQQTNYTNIVHNNAQGCGQFISGFVNMQNVRWMHCDIEIAQEEPDMDIVKLVSVDGGQTFVVANTPPGPTLPQGMTAFFKYIVTNTGNVPITDITVVDSVLGTVGTIPILQPSESMEFIFPPLP